MDLHFCSGAVETDVKDCVLIDPEVHAEVERVDRTCRPYAAHLGKKFDRGIGAFDAGGGWLIPTRFLKLAFLPFVVSFRSSTSSSCAVTNLRLKSGRQGPAFACATLSGRYLT